MYSTRLALSIALVAVALPLQAQTLTINNIAPTWSHVQPTNTSSVSVDNSGSVVRLFWGRAEDDQSAFHFDDRTDPMNVTLVGGVARFNLGKFTHVNNPIGGTALTGARLNILLGLNGTTPGSFTTSLFFNHVETPNSGSCPYGGSSQGCSDRVTLGSPMASQTFTFNSQSYFFNLLGFSSSSTTYTPVSQIVTREGDDNSAYVWAEISRSPNVVPEPSTYALMATGLAGLVGIARRRRTAK
jgi:hypothetical protein